jgi:glucose-1-phosphate cytidylyltransferase
MVKAVILAGGLGSRLSEETTLKPKPMVEIGGRPILWHVMRIYYSYGIDEFIICTGYKGYAIKEYFVNYFPHNSDIIVHTGQHIIEPLGAPAEKWKVWIIDTGTETMTGGRIKRILPYVGDDIFCMTYGDGVGNVRIDEALKQHRSSGRLATVTAVQMPGRFGSLELDGNNVSAFVEKPPGDHSWINGGFFVLSPKVGDYIEGDSTIWEREPMERLAAEGQLGAIKHEGFWHPMDTLRDRHQLESLWATGKAPWKIW